MGKPKERKKLNHKCKRRWPRGFIEDARADEILETIRSMTGKEIREIPEHLEEIIKCTNS